MTNYEHLTLTMTAEESTHDVTVLPFLAFKETYFRLFINGVPAALLMYDGPSDAFTLVGTPHESYLVLGENLHTAVREKFFQNQFQEQPA